MLRNMKAKALALLAVLVLAVGALCTASPAYADEPTLYTTGNGQIVVKSNSVEFKDKAVSAYQIFSADVDEQGHVAYTLNAQFEEFFADKIGESTQYKTAYDYVVAQVGTDGTGAAANKLASDLRTWMNTQDPALSTTYTATASGAAAPYRATISGVPFGYYLVLPQMGSTGNDDRGSDAMMVAVVDAAGETITLKSSYPTVDKQIVGSVNTDGDSASIGDSVNFKLTSKVPDVSNYDTFNFRFTDTFSNGLTFNKDVVVMVGDETLVKDTDYTVDQSGQTITITFTNMKGDIETDSQYQVGDEIVVTYSATLNENATVADSGNSNSAKVEYSNDPNGGYDGSSQPDEVYVYTFDIKVNKYPKGVNDLGGAVFELWKDEKGTQKVALTGSENSYTVDPDGPNYQFTTTNSGDITIKGLEAGTYYLHEVTPPEGYNRLAEDIKIDIAASIDTNGDLTSWSVSVNGTDQQQDNVINVENKTGAQLPSTGGMGTVIFTVVGVAVIAGGAAWYVSRRRSSGAHNA